MRKELNNLINIIRKIVLCFLCVITLFIFTGCTEETPTLKYSEEEYTTLPSEVKGIMKDKKIYITSIGQSNDMSNFEVLIDENMSFLEYTSDSMLNPNEVETNSVVLVFVGCSIKGLSESETSITEETKRAENFVKMSNSDKFKIIAFHLGGPSRRGSVSDDFIKILFENSDFNIFVENGNSDKFLTDISFSSKVPCYQITNSFALEEPIKYMLGLE